jgi:hypothetical protein
MSEMSDRALEVLTILGDPGAADELRRETEARAQQPELFKRLCMLERAYETLPRWASKARRLQARAELDAVRADWDEAMKGRRP